MNFCVHSLGGKSDWNLNCDTHHVSHKGGLQFIKFFGNKGIETETSYPFPSCTISFEAVLVDILYYLRVYRSCAEPKILGKKCRMH